MSIRISSILPFVASFLVYAIVTYPLITNFSTNIYSTYLGDSASILNFNKDYLIENFNDLVFTMFSSYLNNIQIFNLLVLFGFLATFISSYFLFQDLSSSKNPYYGLLFSSFITIAPIRLRYAMEWPDHANWGFIIIYLIYSIRLIKRPDLKYIISAATFYWLSTFNNYYHGLILLFVTVPVIVLILCCYKNRKYAFLFCIAILASSLPSIYLVSMPVNSDGTSLLDVAFRSESDRFAYSARPWNYVIPDIYNPVFGNLATKLYIFIWNIKPYYLTEIFFPKEHSLTTSITLGAVAAIVLIQSLYKKTILNKENISLQFFILIGITAFLISMPPYIIIGGIKVYLPSSIISSVLPQVRAFARFGLIVYISVVAISYMGFVKFMNGRKIINALLLILVIIELINFPPPNNLKVYPLPPYNFLKTYDKSSYNVLMLPRTKDYTDILYTRDLSFKPFNPYSKRDEYTKLVEDSIFNDHYCLMAKSENIKYLINRKYDIKLSNEIELVKNKQVPSRYLKERISESWGHPIFGNHVPKSDADILKNKLEVSLESDLKKDPKFEVIFEDDIYVVLRINKAYCASL